MEVLKMTNIKKITELLEGKKSDLASVMDDLSIDFANNHKLDTNNYLRDLISEYADWQVDYYNDDLANWLRRGGDYYVERYVEEIGIDTRNFNFWQVVSGGQFLELEERLLRDESDIIEVLAINYLLSVKNEIEKDLTEEDLDEIIEEVKSQINSNDRLSDAADVVDGYIFKKELA